MANIGFVHGDCCIVCCHLPDTRKPCIENRSVQTGSAYYLIIAFSVTLLSQLGGNKDHSTKICESCLTCMLVAVRSECEFVRKFPLKYSRGHFQSDGHSPLSIDVLKIMYKGVQSSYDNDRRTAEGMPSGLRANLMGSLHMNFRTSSGYAR